MAQPFNESNMKERKLDLNLSKVVDSDNTLDEISEKERNEAMKLYEEIAEIFMKHDTSLETSYMVLAAMADSIYNYAVFGDEA